MNAKFDYGLIGSLVLVHSCNISDSVKITHPTGIQAP